jgi:hypothetical protein
MPLLDLRMNDGSRHFASLPEHYDAAAPEWHRLRAHIRRMPGAEERGFSTDDLTEAWLDWAYRGHRFAANNQVGEWCLFVDDPTCPEEILSEVVDWCAQLLGSGR